MRIKTLGKGPQLDSNTVPQHSYVLSIVDRPNQDAPSLIFNVFLTAANWMGHLMV